MSQEVKVTVYTINELSKEAKEKVFNRERNFNADCSIVTDDISEHFKSELEARGLPHEDISFSLGYSQGDGMAFYGSLDLQEFMKKNPEIAIDHPEMNIDKAFNEITVEIARNQHGHRYSHYRTMDVNIEGEDDSPYLGYFQETLNELIREVSKKLEGEGYKIIEHTNSDEVILESIEGNEALFLSDGTRAYWAE